MQHIVVIDDAPDFVDLLSDMLKGEGYDVSTATDGAVGLALIRTTHPDVVLCDLGLPRFDGYDIARAVRGDASLARTHLLALSGRTQPDEIERARMAGYEAVLVKPLGVDQVLAEVARAARGGEPAQVSP